MIKLLYPDIQIILNLWNILSGVCIFHMCGGCLSGLGVGATNCTLFEHFFHHPMTSMLLWSKDLNHFTLSSSTVKRAYVVLSLHMIIIS